MHCLDFLVAACSIGSFRKQPYFNRVAQNLEILKKSSAPQVDPLSFMGTWKETIFFSPLHVPQIENESNQEG